MLRNVKSQWKGSSVVTVPRVAHVGLPQVTTADVTAGTDRNVLTGAALPSRSSVELGLWACASASFILNNRFFGCNLAGREIYIKYKR